MLIYPSRTAVDLSGLAYVLQSDDVLERRDRLTALLTPEIIAAVRRLDGGASVAQLVPALAKVNLPPGLRDTLAVFEVCADPLTSTDVSIALQVSQSVASARLTELEAVGLLRLASETGRLRYFERVPVVWPDVHETCCGCGHRFKFGVLTGICEVCIEDKL